MLSRSACIEFKRKCKGAEKDMGASGAMNEGLRRPPAVSASGATLLTWADTDWKGRGSRKHKPKALEEVVGEAVRVQEDQVARLARSRAEGLAGKRNEPSTKRESVESDGLLDTCVC